MKKLNLASGMLYLDGYINIDNLSHYPNAKVDINANVFELEFKENTIDEILVSHFAMYIMGGQDSAESPSQMRQQLTKWYTWLKPGGRLVMETANIKKVAEFIVNCTDPWDLQSSKGLKQIFGWDNTYGHKWAWCPETLIPLFNDVGYQNVDIYEAMFHSKERDFIISGDKF
jgi:hypothetical protein